LAEEYLTFLRDAEEISEYDVKHAQLQLEILQKQIALEDARNNKSQMRLQRNAAGNYDFVYAADEEAINKATEDLLALQQESYNLSKQIYLDTYQAAYEAALKTRDMVVEVAMDASLTTEEQTERIHYILESLNEYLQGSSTALGEISIDIYNSFVDASEAIAEVNQGALSDIFDGIREQAALSQQAMNSTVESMERVGNSAVALGKTVAGPNGVFQSAANSANQAFSTIDSKAKGLQQSVAGQQGVFSAVQGAAVGAFNKIGDEGGILSTKLVGDDGSLVKIRKGTDIHLSGLDGVVNPGLESIDECFGLTSKHSIGDTEDIEKLFKMLLLI
jgi:hypothetical protein